jgi:hypothetical protein
MSLALLLFASLLLLTHSQTWRQRHLILKFFLGDSTLDITDSEVRCALASIRFYFAVAR